MASYTGNLNLKKPALDDDALITDINNNMDILDAAVNGIQDGLAIVANGNTHVAITAGQFVYVRNHGTLTEGLYVASTNIAANATLSTSNLTADSAGGLNTVYASLNSKIANTDFHALTTSQENYTLQESVHYHNGYIKRGGYCFVNISVKCITPGTEVILFENLPLMEPTALGTSVVNNISDDSYSGTTIGMLFQRGNVYLYGGTANKVYRFSFVYPVSP